MWFSWKWENNFKENLNIPDCNRKFFNNTDNLYELAYHKPNISNILNDTKIFLDNINPEQFNSTDFGYIIHSNVYFNCCEKEGFDLNNFTNEAYETIYKGFYELTGKSNLGA